ncbi:nucleotidyltransferase family protein [bacterium]|nr:nucleotidyltransferase family protein [bacterium]
MIDIDKISIGPDASIRQVMSRIDEGAKGIAVVIDGDCRLLGTITDGDIRRAILSGKSLDTRIHEVLTEREQRGGRSPITAMVSTPAAELSRMMLTKGIRHIVVLNSANRVVGLATLEETIPFIRQPVEAVIMAGGRGRRLMPLTNDLPKPMLPVGGRPMLEWIIEGLKRSGITRITISSHYKADVIRRYFGNGWRQGVSISHLYEERPSGTAGALRLLNNWNQTLLVINGDILTWVDFTQMINFHREQNASLTVAVRQHDIQVPYGVVDMDGSRIRRLSEKPIMPYFVNAGIYLLEPSLRSLLGDEDHLDMTDLIERAIQHDQSIIGFPVTEYWADIGQMHDYQKAREHISAQLLGAVV